MNGILLVNKDKDMTSRDVVNIISKKFNTKKVGHSGTLDPIATGVLVIAIGKYTKLINILTSSYKEYIATLKLGIQTDTLDITGNVLDNKDYNVNKELIVDTLNSFLGKSIQEVPKYSAVKVNGKKLYEYARENKEIDLPKKEVTIYELELLDKKDNDFVIRAKVSKGCYIRSLINDIGSFLGVGAIMTSLVRTKQGNITIDNAYTLEDIEKGNYRLLSIEEVIDFPQIVVDNDLEFKIRNGVLVDDMWNITDKVLFKNKNNELLGIYQKTNDGLKTWKNFPKTS